MSIHETALLVCVIYQPNFKQEDNFNKYMKDKNKLWLKKILSDISILYSNKYDFYFNTIFLYIILLNS